MAPSIDIKKAVQDRFGVILPEPMVKEFTDGIAAGKLSEDTLMVIIGKAIEETTLINREWVHMRGGAVAAYIKSPEVVSSGDLLIITSSDENGGGPKYEAFRAGNSAELKYLGSEKNIDAMKNRVEQYALLMLIRERVAEKTASSSGKDVSTVSIAKGSLQNKTKVQETSGMDIY